MRDPALRSTGLALSPEDQIDYSRRTPVHRIPGLRNVGDGDVFRLFTTDPVRYPLPHPLLLQLHSSLWNMLACSGINQTGTERDRRMIDLGFSRRGSQGGRDVFRSRGARGSGGSARIPTLNLFHGAGSTGTGNGDTEHPYRGPSQPNHLSDQGENSTPAADGHKCRPLPLETEYLIFKLAVLDQDMQNYENEYHWESSNDGCCLSSDDFVDEEDEEESYEYAPKVAVL